eukprot:jgi/Chlat1/3794/Chrsp259S03924
MEAAARMLAEGRGGASNSADNPPASHSRRPLAPLCLVFNTSSRASTSSHRTLVRLWAHLARRLARAGTERGIVVVALAGLPSWLAGGLESQRQGRQLVLLDCFTDPCGWAGEHNQDKAEHHERISSSQHTCTSSYQTSRGLSNPTAILSAMGDLHSTSPISVIFDDISLLTWRHGAHGTAQLITKVQRMSNVESVLALCHAGAAADNGASPSLSARLELMSTTVVRVISTAPDVVETTTKLRKGRYRRAVQDIVYTAGSADITFKTISKASAKISAATPDITDKALPFRLSLNELEKSQRQRVVLPYEHQTAKPIYDGGRKSDEALAGHILYERDSDDDYDSDEDPYDEIDV